MSQENVETVRRAIEVFNRDGPKAVTAFFDPEIEWHDLPEQVDAGVHYGRKGFLESIEQFAGGLEEFRVLVDEIFNFLAAFRDYRYEAEEYNELDDERVFVPGHMAGGHGKASKLAVLPDEMTRGLARATGASGGANLLHIRQGKARRLVMYLDRDRAFADLGLTPEGDQAA